MQASRPNGDPPRIALIGALCIVILCSWALPAAADVVNLQASKDNTLYQDADGDVSNGSGAYIFAGRTNTTPPVGEQLRRGLVAFNVSSIPSGSTVNSATLTLYMSRTQAGAQNVSVHKVTSNWGEGASNAPGQEGDGDNAEANDATWLHTFYNTSMWTTPGGDYVGAASATTSVAGTGVYYIWSSAGMVADVQGWVNSPATNFGWILIGNEAVNQTAKRFNSLQNNTAAQRPVLTVNFTPPATTGACCFTDGSCLILSSTDCANQSGTYQGDGTSCTPNPCPQPTGACCFNDGTCQEREAADCTMQGGVFQGTDTSCTPNPCIGACCFANGSCAELNIDDCAAGSGIYQGLGTTCPADPTDLCPVVLTPFIDPLPIPPLATPTVGTPGGAATYDMNIVQVQQQLHSELPPTTVWTYEGMYPGPTILATRDVPITVNWINDLPPGSHYLPVETCPHGASDEPKVVTHLHGGHVPAAVDGYPEDTFLPGNMVTYEYPNNQLPSLIWYHDHALGITRLNVYMGMAGGYLITDAFEQGLNLPSGEYDVPLIIQDRSFKSDGTWKYPALWQDHFFGDKMLVNGMVWPFLNVEQGKYRLRLLNGCNSRVLTLSMSNGAPFTLIGMDGGLLETPVSGLTELTLGGAERADVIVDFAAYAPGTEIILQNSAPAPFPGTPGVGVLPDVMKFVVQNDTGFTDPVPTTLRPMEVLQEGDAVQTRDFELQKFPDACGGSHWLINELGWNAITEFPVLGTTEIWRFINRSGVTHPMHMHLVFFQVLDRQPFEVVGDVITPIGSPLPPEPTESGWKDTVQVGSGEIVRVIARFEDYVGLYPYHCHILEHEDHEMMRQFDAVCCKGDTNQDVKLTAADIQGFVDTMVGGGQVGTAAYCATDMDDNGALDLVADGDLFVNALLAGQACLP